MEAAQLRDTVSTVNTALQAAYFPNYHLSFADQEQGIYRSNNLSNPGVQRPIWLLLKGRANWIFARFPGKTKLWGCFQEHDPSPAAETGEFRSVISQHRAQQPPPRPTDTNCSRTTAVFCRQSRSAAALGRVPAAPPGTLPAQRPLRG